MVRQDVHIVKGMQKDISVSKANKEFVFDAHNIRITARDNNTLFSVSNEKGNRQLDMVSAHDDEKELKGIYLGHAILNNYIVIFTKDDNYDYINRIKFCDELELCIIYKGNLNFSLNNPIEALAIYENDEVQKVYWVDGLNQPRVVNISDSAIGKQNYNDKSFDFVTTLQLNEKVEISKGSASGKFTPGVIQYAFTYYNKYGQESNIFYISRLHYITNSDRGASPEDIVNASFNIDIENIDSSFDFLRIYSIYRSSVNSTPVVTRLSDIEIKDSHIKYTDTNSGGESVDPSFLLYVGGESISAGTMTHKDNTLFLGNLKLKTNVLNDVRAEIGSLNIEFEQRVIDESEVPTGTYDYKFQLNKSDNKSFKSYDWYRFGVQFQYDNGRWSEPLYIGDFRNSNVKPEVVIENNHLVTKVVQAKVTLPKEIIAKVKNNNNVIKARGVIVYPEASDREVVAQGILCPTVYNLGDRFDNRPFAQASWFSRPDAAFDYSTHKDDFKGIGLDMPSAQSPGGTYADGEVTISPYDFPPFGIKMDFTKYGSWAEFRHNKPIPDNWNRNAEIQCIADVPDDFPWTSKDKNSLIESVRDNQEYYYIDKSIVTFHSPDFEFSDSVKNNMDLKMRIVGVVPITANSSDVDIQTENDKMDPEAIGFYKEPVEASNLSIHGYKGLVSQILWIDGISDNTLGEDATIKHTGFLVYPWHRSGSLNNASVKSNLPDNDDAPRPSVLKNKKMSNLKYSAFTKYFDKYWMAESDDGNHNGITQVQFFNSDNVELLRIPEPKNSGIGSINYYGNVDKVLFPSRLEKTYTVSYDEDVWNDIKDKMESREVEFNKSNGYPIISAYKGKLSTDKYSYHDIVSMKLAPITMQIWCTAILGCFTSTITGYGYDPVHIKYKSTPHAVFAFNYTNDGKQVILPSHKESISGNAVSVNDENITSEDKRLFWSNDKDIKGVYQDSIDEYISNPTEKSDSNYGFLYLAELYDDSIVNRFGGTSESALSMNQWIPAGDAVHIEEGKDITLYYTEGDTYFQRYDCLKTYPFTLEDTNSIVEIVSFMCETRINIDGRYDRNRGQESNLVMSPSNFNKLNKVYSQRNNFFTYRTYTFRDSLNVFKNTITWTKEKHNAELTDTWTNITMASTLDLDGDKGEITSLNTFNNEIFCFQERGLSNILFNSRVQIPTSDNTPIEITNGLKVNGKRYLSDIGCNNKWSIAESPRGIYFIDNITSGMYLFNGQIQSISDACGFSQWIGKFKYKDPWNPIEFNNFISFYDKNNGDVYFTGKDTCLCYSEAINQFTSFMDYNEVPLMFNIKDSFYALKNNKIWKQFDGEYNMIFDEFKPYDITFISNPDEPYDKIFDNIEFRSDSWDGEVLLNDATFDSLEVWNEYQRGHSELKFDRHRPSTLKRKFRVWRANIPRDKDNPRNRIRNTWAYIKLGMNRENTYRTELHDMIVKYFI